MRQEESPVVTREGTVSGSPLYMVPEQIMRSHPPDARTDIYAMGAILYFLLTGKPPFPGTDSMAVMVAHVRDPVVPPSRLQAGLPADLELVALCCLAKNPADRYQDAESLARALSACADAGSWSAIQAETWWKEHEPAVLSGPGEALPAEPHSTQLIAPSELTRAESEVATFAASGLEMASEEGSGGGLQLSVSLGDEETSPERSS